MPPTRVKELSNEQNPRRPRDHDAQRRAPPHPLRQRTRRIHARPPHPHRQAAAHCRRAGRHQPPQPPPRALRDRALPRPQRHAHSDPPSAPRSRRRQPKQPRSRCRWRQRRLAPHAGQTPVHPQSHRSPQQALQSLPQRLLRRDLRHPRAPQHGEESRATQIVPALIPATERNSPMTNTLADPTEMIRRGAPRLIRSAEELDEYSRVLFTLTATPRPTAAEQQAINLITLLIEHYETLRYPLPEARSVEVLRFLMTSNSVSEGKITPELGFSASASLILLGQRQLNRG